MQRAAASSQPPTPLAPSSEPPTKRQRISISKSQSPLASPISADVQAFHAAADLEEAKRTAAIERIAAEAGETKWVLSTADAGQTNGTDRKLRFLTAGYSDIDQATAQATGLRHGEMGRRSFGRFNKDIEVTWPLPANYGMFGWQC